MRHHDALRLRFVRGAAGWEQANAGDEGETPFSYFDFSQLAESERTRAVAETATGFTKWTYLAGSDNWNPTGQTAPTG